MSAIAGLKSLEIRRPVSPRIGASSNPTSPCPAASSRTVSPGFGASSRTSHSVTGAASFSRSVPRALPARGHCRPVLEADLTLLVGSHPRDRSLGSRRHPRASPDALIILDLHLHRAASRPYEHRGRSLHPRPARARQSRARRGGGTLRRDRPAVRAGRTSAREPEPKCVPVGGARRPTGRARRQARRAPRGCRRRDSRDPPRCRLRRRRLERLRAQPGAASGRSGRADRPARRCDRPPGRAASRGRRPLPGLHAVLARLGRHTAETSRRRSRPRSGFRPGIDPGRLPTLAELGHGAASPGLPRGGEPEGCRLALPVSRGRPCHLRRHPQRLLAGLDLPALALPPLRLRLAGRARASRARAEGAEPFLRQLCWRDFYLQLLAARPDLPRADYRPRGDEWREDEEAFAAWKEGLTGYPIVDAGDAPASVGGLDARACAPPRRVVPRQGSPDPLAARRGPLLRSARRRRPGEQLRNWQWVAGTGTDTRPNRVLNPVRQALRFDPDGAYVRRYVPELASLPANTIHEPWKLGATALAGLGYPAPLVDHAEASAAFTSSRARRAASP